MVKSILKLPVFSCCFLFFCVTIRICHAQVVINEVMVKPGSDALSSQYQSMKYCSQPTYGSEYIELYNTNPCDSFDISCYLIGMNTNFGAGGNHGTFRFPQGTIIPPLGFLSIGAPNTGATINLFNFCGTPYLSTENDRWYLANGDCYLIIWDNTGAAVDAVYWTSSAGQASKWGTDSDIDIAPTFIAAGVGCNLLSSLPGPSTIPLTSGIVSYAGISPSMGLVIHRTIDGDSTWATNAGPTLNACNGTCNTPTVLSVSINVTQPVCGANNGTATANVSGGTAPYSYSWSNGQTDSTATGLSAGSYFVTVTSASGCSVTDTADVANSGGPSVATSATAATCGNDNGTATANATGGTPPYSYLWSAVPPQTDSVATGLAPGNYSVTVTDNSGCIVNSSVNVPASPAVTVSVTPATCADSNGTATANPSGGTLPYTFLWNTLPSQNTQTATGLIAGNYSITVTDSSGCTASATATVTGGPTLTVTANASTCGNSDGNATANPVGGLTPYTYLWSNSQSTQIITGLIAGSYFVTVTDGNGCTKTGTATVGSTGGPAVAVTFTNTTCNGGSDGTANASANGGTLPYTFTWSNSQTDSTATGLSAGAFTVTITDAGGCSATSSTTITQPPLISLTIIPVNASCGGNNGSATATASGGVGSFSYLWSDSQTGSTATGLSAGTYTVTVTDASGCTDTTSATITGPPDLILTVTGTNAICGGTPGQAIATVTGGTPGYFYNWSNGSTLSALTDITGGTYSVTVTDSLNCSKNSSITITVSSTVTVDAGDDTTIFAGGQGTLSAEVTGATSPLTFIWQPGNIDGQNITVQPATDEIYSVMVTDVNGCTGSDTVKISVTNCAEPFVPTAFSPNGDNNNDMLFVRGFTDDCVTGLTFVVYNRWGQKVFDTNTVTKGWDGIFNGKATDTGVFVWYLNAKWKGGDEKVKKGNVTLVR
ncbi:MAG: gliding motility-associated C-terminal domain-containing protein [Bacteroidetes bacterium]|nr:gliding motility-associated C-terminal domain-containing protein [Bacteroidota bacterium]